MIITELFEGKGGLEILYDAENDGYSARVFHKKCDNIPSTVTLVSLKNGCVFGGFNPESWESHPRGGLPSLQLYYIVAGKSEPKLVFFFGRAKTGGWKLPIFTLADEQIHPQAVSHQKGAGSLRSSLPFWIRSHLWKRFALSFFLSFFFLYFLLIFFYSGLGYPSDLCLRLDSLAACHSSPSSYELPSDCILAGSHKNWEFNNIIVFKYRPQSS